jgi:DNA-3-methyladenine glycosylase
VSAAVSPAQHEPGRAWFARSVLDVAADLLGAHLTHSTPEGSVTLRLTEVEAYGGLDDPGSHAARGVTLRNRSMALPGGHLYAYRHLGLHTCLNVVAGPEGSPSAVLLRGAEVVDGEPLALARRTERGVAKTARDLARGPARLAVALGVGVDHDGADLLERGGCLTLTVCGSQPTGAPADASLDQPGAVLRGPRVGVSGPGGDGELFPWRLWLAGEPTVSAYRAVSPRRR